MEFKRATVKIWHLGEDTPNLVDQRIEVELSTPSKMLRGMINLETWNYSDYVEGVICMIAACYKTGVDVATEEFQDAIIKARNLAIEKAKLS